MLLNRAIGPGHESEVAPSLPVFSLPIISDHLESSLGTTEHSPAVDEYSSSNGSTEDEPVSSDCSGTCILAWH